MNTLEFVRLTVVYDGARCQVYQACSEVPAKGLFYPPTLITGVQTVSSVVVEEVSIS